MKNDDSPSPKGSELQFPAHGESPAVEPLDHDPVPWVRARGLRSTADVAVPKLLIEQVIGQEEAVEVARKAAEQKRNLLLIGEPGTGKSMIAKAMAEMLPAEKQKDILVYHNNKTPNNPKVAIVDGGVGRRIVEKYERKASKKLAGWRVFEWGVGLGVILFGLYMWIFLAESILAFLFCVLIAILFVYFAGQNRPKREFLVPKLLQEHSAEPERAPFVDGTGSHAGALLGDVRHDPYQSGGLETPPHVRVEEGAIHRANHGVLFIDEINVLRLPSQQALLTAMQNKEYQIVGQSQSSAGAMIRTQPVPCDFILVAAGNLDAVQPPSVEGSGGMHPALRSRIRGYGYEVFVSSVMEDTASNREKLLQFVAQEVIRDGRIPHFTAEAAAEVIRDAQRRTGRTGKLTLRLRELGGLVRTAGDIARSAGHDLVTAEDVRGARRTSRSLEQQILEKEIQATLDSAAIRREEGTAVGVALGMAVVGTGEVGEPAGVLVPVEAAVVPALSRYGGAIVLGPGLKAKGTTVENVGAVLKTLKGEKIADHDIHVDARFAHKDADADGVGMAAAIAAISALESLPVRQDVAFVGDVAVNGALRPVRATLQRVEAAVSMGLRAVVVPAATASNLILDEETRRRIEIIPCDSLADVLNAGLEGSDAQRVSVVSRLTDHGIPR